MTRTPINCCIQPEAHAALRIQPHTTRRCTLQICDEDRRRGFSPQLARIKQCRAAEEFDPADEGDTQNAQIEVEDFEMHLNNAFSERTMGGLDDHIYTGSKT